MARMIASDPVRYEDRHRTPLFRDTRGLRDLGDGTFEGGGKPLSNAFIRKLIRQLVRANPEWFGARDPESFGIHAFRIGAMNDLLDAGADFFVISALGRWVSQSVMDYHRMKRSTEYAWRKKATNLSLASAGNPSLVTRKPTKASPAIDNLKPAPAHVRWSSADQRAAYANVPKCSAYEVGRARETLSRAIRAKADLAVAKASPPSSTQASIRLWLR
jgi:hypothetical protein